MAKKILGAFVAAVLVLVVVVALQPSTYHVERTLVVPADPGETYAILSDFKRFNEWSPWAELDPDMNTTFSGAETGKGAVYEWSGNDQVGKGKMEITSATPHERVDMHLTFIEPFASESETYYTLKPADGGTQVTWAMDGQNNFMSKAMGLFMDMEQMIGKDFDKGLAKLQAVAKADATKAAEARAMAEKAKMEAEAAAEAPTDGESDAEATP